MMGGGFSATAADQRGSYEYGAEPVESSSRETSRQSLGWIGKTLDLPAKIVNLESHFQICCLLGTGMLGRVRLVQHKKLKKYYALKTMQKAEIMEQNMLRHVENEREALQKVSKLQHPFIIKYFGSFQTPQHVHLLLEYVPGGELLHRLHQVGTFTNDEAKFYATELVVFIEFCRSHRYIYRDLKPENVLLDAQGHVKVVDLGFIRGVSDLNERCTTSVGTAQYLAPEQLTQSRERRSYTSAVDWWALACMIFEMVNGKTPFVVGEHDTAFEIYTRIIQGKIQWPRGMQSSLKDLLKQMLHPDLDKRLCDVEGIKQHAWFANVSWQDVRCGEIQPPFVPTISCEGDHSNFDHATSLKHEDDEDFSSKGGPALHTFEFRNF
ncbi:hypothetical protein Poli38472_002975 [Pythium oligandrum]|uniref:AGC/PKA protein kinase n=1 Tax=Pythium oligandrum TaxID=41045 RepID=A0A8K1C647_PYTOL|nr:hypothetical protein Poli38472_002975 [Pythium oligandrum]|eukprot:TMW57050.1 hypothetical protein Poli38472_002975 [Pythium oligandrum]